MEQLNTFWWQITSFHFQQYFTGLRSADWTGHCRCHKCVHGTSWRLAWCHGTISCRKSLFDSWVHVFMASTPDSDPPSAHLRKWALFDSLCSSLMAFGQCRGLWSLMTAVQPSGSFDAVHHLLLCLTQSSSLLPTDKPSPALDPCNANREQCKVKKHCAYKYLYIPEENFIALRLRFYTLTQET